MQINKYIAIIIASLVLLGLFCDVPAGAQNAPLSAIPVISSYGNTATVPVTATNMSDVASFSLKISYDQSVVQPVTVTTTPQINGTLSVNLNNPGFILLSWFTFPGINLSGNTVILNIEFSKIANGISALNFIDDGNSCAWYNSNYSVLNDLPFSTYYTCGSVAFISMDAPHTIIPYIDVCQGILIGIPVKITGFTSIGKVALELNYDVMVLGYQSFTNTSGFPGLTVDGSQPGILKISGIVPSGGAGFSLSDSSVLLTLNFSFSGGVVGLTWFDNGVSCQYSGPPPSFLPLNDTPQNIFYINGTVSEIPLPVAAGTITGPPGGNVCPGQSGVNLSVAPVQNATSYIWSLPPGALITSGASTNNITVTFGNSPGNWDMMVSGNNTCGNGPASPFFSIYINDTPVISTQPVSPATVNAGAGSAFFTVGASGSLLTYQWQEFVTTWTNLSNTGVYSGVFSPTLTITNPLASMDGNHYRCIISGFCPPEAISDGEASLSVSTVSGTKNDDQDAKGDQMTLSLSIHPNPVRFETTLSYFLPDEGNVRIEIWNIYGKKMDILFSGIQKGGTHELRTTLHLNPGLYVATLLYQTGTDGTITAEKILIK
jgi:hypothetical protein